MDRKTILMISTMGFFGIFSTTISKNPVLPLLVQSLGAGDAVIGLIAAVSPLAGILFSFPVGLLSDRLGKKRLLLVSAAVFVSAPLLYLFVRDAWWLVPIRFFHGMATAILGPVTSALICGAYPDTKGEKLGLYSSATLVGRTLAPLLGGAVISVWGFRPVYAAAFLLAVPVLAIALLLKEVGDPAAVQRVTPAAMLESLAAFLRTRKLMGTALVEMAAYFAYGSFETYLPLELSRRGIPAYQVGMVFSVQVLSIALTKPLFGRLSDRIDRRVQIAAGILVIGGSIAAVPWIGPIVGLAAIAIFFGLGMSLVTVATSTYVADAAKKDNLGASLGALSSIMDIGHSSGPFITGIVMTAFSTAIGFAVSLAVCAASALVFILATRSGKGTGAAAAETR